MNPMGKNLKTFNYCKIICVFPVFFPTKNPVNGYFVGDTCRAKNPKHPARPAPGEAWDTGRKWEFWQFSEGGDVCVVKF